MGMIATLLLKALSGLAMSLMSEKVIKELVMFGMKRLVESTDNTWDNELMAIAESKWNETK
jgi:hypothetical protein